MIHLRNTSRKTSAVRKGVAAVELVMVLPLLLLIMAITFAYAFNATWQLRTQTVARDFTWRNRAPHDRHWNTNRNSQNPEWPSPRDSDEVASRADVEHFPLTALDDDEVCHRPVIRGPLPSINVNSEQLNLARSVDMGRARLRRKPNIVPELGRVDLDTRFILVSDQFTYQNMALVVDNLWWSNYVRRFPKIYETELDHLEENPEFISAHARVEIARAPDCLNLDEDAEFFDWYGDIKAYPDFHPRLKYFESLDHDWVREERIQPLLNEIERVPRRIGQRTIRLYREMISSGTLAAGEVERLTREIQQIKSWISSLE